MGKIVLLHYNRRMGDTITNLLRRSGYDVFRAENSLDAWSQIRSVQPDLVITDYPAFVTQPENTRQDTIASLVRTTPELQHIPVLSLTADASADWLSEAASAGVTQSIVLPVSGEELLAIVGAYVQPRSHHY